MWTKVSTQLYMYVALSLLYSRELCTATRALGCPRILLNHVTKVLICSKIFWVGFGPMELSWANDHT